MNTRNLIVGIFSVLVCMSSIQAQAESTSWCSPDSYGHALCDPIQPTTDATIEAGEGDMYGSVLLDVPAKVTTAAVSEGPWGDKYARLPEDWSPYR
ncbi:hypothetical protein [Thiobacillus sp.]|uniref:hypothetical protein n=1 Tax=Thiobacillus sp. TaxID=924 RepID=UPI0025E1A90F|nr:hypothetical protein [Thiobacillus sp.]MBT9540973.1 hypothetical protein [Thiobacillus sp.]